MQYDFVKPAQISSSQVYWYDDGPFGGCRVPASWRILYKQGDSWVPVKNVGPYSNVKDAYSAVKFDPVTTGAVRMEVTLPKEHSGGIMEWVVE